MTSHSSPVDPPSIAGRGLFSDRPVTCRIRPLPAGSGLRFARIDLPGNPVIPARIASLCPHPPILPMALAARSTNLWLDPAKPEIGVLTIEHLLSACAGLGVWDALIELDGPELPIDDGSSAIFLAALRSCVAHPIQPLSIHEPVRVQDPKFADRWIQASPRSAPGATYTYHLDYGPGAPITAQSATFELTEHSRDRYARDIAPARTFSLEAEAASLRKLGLFQSFSPRDLLVIGPAGPIENQWRFDNEPARHKLLDLIGDLALVGRPIQADITSNRAGHALNHAMARALLEASV